MTKKIAVYICGIPFGVLMKDKKILMISADPDRLDAHLPGPWSKGPARETKALLTRVLQGEKRIRPDFGSNPFLAEATPFQRRVWMEICGIGRGETKTYGEIAARLGNPGLARAVGLACNANPLALVIPCHRVVGKNGTGGYAGGTEAKIRLLEMEGALPPLTPRAGP